MRLHYGLERAEAMGLPSRSKNALRRVSDELSSLYLERPRVRHSTAGELPGFLGPEGIVGQAGLWPLMRRVQMYTLALREMLIRPEWERKTGRLSYRLVFPDTVIVRAGTYSERVSVNKSGASGALISVEAATGERVVTNGFTLGSSGVVSYVRVKGFEITGSGTGVSLNAANSQIVGNYIHHTRGGVMPSGTASNHKSNLISGNRMAYIVGTNALADGDALQREPDLGLHLFDHQHDLPLKRLRSVNSR
jgi:hypothetical protein